MENKFKVICTGYNQNYEKCFTIGKEYEWFAGRLTNDNGHCYTKLVNSDDISKWDLNAWYSFEKVVERNKIIITTDGTTTTATLYEGKRTVKSASAMCAPDDKYDFNAGAKLAFDRLMGREEIKSSPCVWEAFKAGKFAVHCDTEQKAKAFLKECIGNNVRWFNGKDTSVDYTLGFTEAGCYSYYARHLQHANIDHWKEYGQKIVDYPFTNAKEDNLHLSFKSDNDAFYPLVKRTPKIGDRIIAMDEMFMIDGYKGN